MRSLKKVLVFKFFVSIMRGSLRVAVLRNAMLTRDLG